MKRVRCEHDKYARKLCEQDEVMDVEFRYVGAEKYTKNTKEW